jgi:hypothetical protein
MSLILTPTISSTVAMSERWKCTISVTDKLFPPKIPFTRLEMKVSCIVPIWARVRVRWKGSPG